MNQSILLLNNMIRSINDEDKDEYRDRDRLC